MMYIDITLSVVRYEYSGYFLIKTMV